MSIQLDPAAGTTDAQPKIELDELDGFGRDIGKSLSSLLDKWKTDESGRKKNSLLRRISTKSKNFLLKKKNTSFTEEDIEEMRERVEQVPLAPPALSSKGLVPQIDPEN